MTAKPAEALPKTDWFRADLYHPALPGTYQISHPGFGLGWATWDGERWADDNDAHFRAEGSQYLWRGQHRWVLVRQTGAGPAFLIAARRGFNSWTDLPVQARPFLTQREASRFAARHQRLRLTAVLA